MRHNPALFPPSQCVCLCHPSGDKRKDCPQCYVPSDSKAKPRCRNGCHTKGHPDRRCCICGNLGEPQ